MNATQSTAFQVVSKPSPVAHSSAYWDGFDAHCQGQPLEDMPTVEHRNGWWWANACAGETLAYEDDMMDRAFWARGGF